MRFPVPVCTKYCTSFHTAYIPMYVLYMFCRCIVPGINLLTPVLDFGKCFVNHPYEMTMELMNDSDLPAKYELISQVRLTSQFAFKFS